VRIREVAVLAGVAALGCNSATAPAGGVSATCQVTLSGAVSGSYNCYPATTLWTSASDSGGFTFGVTASGTRPLITAAVVWPGQPKDSTYTNAGAGAQAAIIVTTSANQTWTAAVGGGGAATGSYSLTFTSVAQNGSSAGGKGYAADGTLNATLTAVTASGASGVMVLTATF
jgi:hypothetical protein